MLQMQTAGVVLIRCGGRPTILGGPERCQASNRPGPGLLSSGDIFETIVNTDAVDFLVRQINAYADQKIVMNTPITKGCRLKSWKPVNLSDVIRLFCVFI